MARAMQELRAVAAGFDNRSCGVVDLFTPHARPHRVDRGALGFEDRIVNLSNLTIFRIADAAGDRDVAVISIEAAELRALPTLDAHRQARAEVDDDDITRLDLSITRLMVRQSCVGA